MTTRNKAACPHCGEPLKRVRISYGLPTPEAMLDPNVVLGGCDPDGPTWACAACRRSVRRAPSKLRNNVPETA